MLEFESKDQAANTTHKTLFFLITGNYRQTHNEIMRNEGRKKTEII